MTELEWRTAELPDPLWHYVRARASERDCRLFACACVRRIEGFLRDDRLRGALQFAEDTVDSLPNPAERARAAAMAAEGCVAGAGVLDTFCPNEGAYALWFLPPDEKRRLEEAYQAACRAAEELQEPLEAVLSAEAAVAAYLAAFGDMRGEAGRALMSWADRGGRRATDFEALWDLGVDADEEAAQRALVWEIFGNPFHPITCALDWRTHDTVSLARTMYESRDFSAMPILADALQDAGCGDAAVLDHCRGPGPHVRGCWVVDLVLGKE